MDERFIRWRRAPIDDEGEWEDAFWRLHLYVGIGSFTLGALLLFVYFRLTPHGPHRLFLSVLALVSIVAWLAVFGPLGLRAIRSSRRSLFFFCWSLTTLALIAVTAGLDGAETSPVLVLLVLPVLFAALVYSPLEVGALTLVAVVFFVLVVATAGGTMPATALVTGIMLALAGTISVTAAVNREIKDGARRRLARKLHDLATHDGLTGCLTYHAFGDTLAAESDRARRYGNVFSLVMADIDFFKAVNDDNGHDVGDATLRAVAHALGAGGRAADVTGRIGGDEFALLLPETDHLQALRVARRLQQSVREARSPVPVTVSYGWATWSGPDDTAAALRRRADRALYAAKDAGRDRLAAWDPNDGIVCPSSVDGGTVSLTPVLGKSPSAPHVTVSIPASGDQPLTSWTSQPLPSGSPKEKNEP